MKNQGYILVFTLLIIALSVFVGTYIASRASIFFPLSNTLVEREKAYQLAMSGVSFAMSQLSVAPKPKSEAEKKDQAAAKPNAQGTESVTLLQTLLPALNRFQTIRLTQKNDGVEGIISWAITSEEGKININGIFDFKKKKFVGQDAPTGDYSKLMQELFGSMGSNGPEMYQAFATFLKQQKGPINDVTQLFELKEFAQFKNKLFYQPPTNQPESDKKTTRPLYLTDIFTTFSAHPTGIYPWVFSDSVAGLLGLKRAQFGDIKQRKKDVSNWLKKFKFNSQWKTDWNPIMAPLYDREFSTLPKGIETLLQNGFGLKFFSVLSYGTVGRITQKILALLERIRVAENDGTVRYEIRIKKVYLL